MPERLLYDFWDWLAVERTCFVSLLLLRLTIFCMILLSKFVVRSIGSD
jgi:hypothetical protein